MSHIGTTSVNLTHVELLELILAVASQESEDIICPNAEMREETRSGLLTKLRVGLSAVGPVGSGRPTR